MKGILSLVLIILITNAFGTHIRAGYISAKPLSCLEYEITIRVFTDTSSPIKFGEGELRFGDGILHTTPEMPNTFPPGPYREVGFVEYTIKHTYEAAGAYLISYTEANRNAGILNLTNSVNIAFHTETKLIIDPLIGCFQTPTLLTPTAFTVRANDTLNLSFAVSSDEDLIFRYELVNPLNIPPNTYILPENAYINNFNGLLTWGTQFKGLHLVGEFLFTIKISYWTIHDDVHKYMGYTMVDTQITLEESDHSTSITSSKDYGEYGRVYVPVGYSETIKVIYKGIDNKNIELNAYTDLVDTPEVFSFTTYDSAENIKVGLLILNSVPAIERNKPYVVTVRGIESPQYFPSDINFMLFTRDVFPDVITNVQEDLGWSVYPNPITDILNFDLPADMPYCINLLDVQGKKIDSWGNPKTIDTSAWSTGLYIVEIVYPRGRKVLKVIKH